MIVTNHRVRRAASWPGHTPATINTGSRGQKHTPKRGNAMQPATLRITLTMCALCLLAMLCSSASQAESIQVDETGSPAMGIVVVDGGDGYCSLREAIIAANNHAAYNECTLSGPVIGLLYVRLPLAATFTLFDGPYVSTADPAGPNGLPVVTGNFIIAGYHSTIRRDIEAAVPPRFRLLQVDSGADLKIINTTLASGWASGQTHNTGGCVYNRGHLTLKLSHVFDCNVGSESFGGRGGGIYNGTGGTLNIVKSTVMGNSSSLPGIGGFGGFGGGIFNIGTMTMSGSSVEGNMVAGDNGAGGGVYNAAMLTVEDSTITDNDANVDNDTSDDTHRGGGILNAGTLVLTDSTISENSARFGGGLGIIGSNSVTTVLRSTFNANIATRNGAGVFVRDGTVVVGNSTIANNDAYSGGALYLGNSGNYVADVELGYVSIKGNTGFAIVGYDLSTLTLAHDIIAATVVACYSIDTSKHVVSTGYNLASDGSCVLTAAGDQQGIDPQLASLADNGGATETLLPLPGSPLIDAIPAADCALNAPVAVDTTVDQRGATRPQGQGCDIGAVEVAPYVANFVAYGGSGQHTLAGDPFAWPLVVQALDVSGNAVAGLALAIDAPTSGASASCAPAVTDPTGVLLAYCVANMQQGSYTIDISAPLARSYDGVPKQRSFTLTNDFNDRIFGTGFEGSPLASITLAAGQMMADPAFEVPPGLLAGRIVPILVVRDAQGHRVALVEARRSRNGTRIRVIEYDARGYPASVGGWQMPAAARMQLHVDRSAARAHSRLQAAEQ